MMQVTLLELYAIIGELEVSRRKLAVELQERDAAKAPARPTPVPAPAPRDEESA